MQLSMKKFIKKLIILCSLLIVGFGSFYFFKAKQNTSIKVHLLFEQVSFNNTLPNDRLFKLNNRYGIVVGTDFKDSLGLKIISKAAISAKKIKSLTIVSPDSLSILLSNDPYNPERQVFIIEEEPNGKLFVHEVMPFEVIKDTF